MEGWQQAGARIAQTTRAEKMERWEEVIQELLLEKSGCQGMGVVLYFSIGISVQRTGMQVLGARKWGSASSRPKVEKMYKGWQLWQCYSSPKERRSAAVGKSACHYTSYVRVVCQVEFLLSP